MITLRTNQPAPISLAIEFFLKKKSVPSLIVLPTAWGKSILTAYVAKQTIDKILVLQPTKELLEQNYKKYLSLCEFETHAGIYSASFGRKEISKITYATIGSIKNIGSTFKQMGFTKLLIDEAHLYPRESESMLGKFLQDSGITHILGITATPIKLQSGTDRNGERYSKLVMLTSRSKKGNFFKDIIHVGQVQEMVEMGFWSPLIYQTLSFDGSLLEYNSSKSEFTEESIQQAFISNDLSRKIINILQSTDRGHILVFVPSVAEGISLSEQCPNSAVVYGLMDSTEREKVIGDFKSGNLRVIFNVRVLSTGFDYTGIDCIILGMSTASIALYYQIIGRATRIDDDKKDSLIIDLTGNVDRFGKVEDIRFEKGAIWRMFGTDGKLLSGVPISDIGQTTYQDVARLEKERQESLKPIEIMPFGKFKDLKIKDLPMSYRRWMLDNFSWSVATKKLKQSIELSFK